MECDRLGGAIERTTWSSLIEVMYDDEMEACVYMSGMCVHVWMSWPSVHSRARTRVLAPGYTVVYTSLLYDFVRSSLLVITSHSAPSWSCHEGLLYMYIYIYVDMYSMIMYIYIHSCKLDM
jgi:hypothetical protein